MSGTGAPSSWRHSVRTSFLELLWNWDTPLLGPPTYECGNCVAIIQIYCGDPHSVPKLESLPWGKDTFHPCTVVSHGSPTGGVPYKGLIV